MCYFGAQQWTSSIANIASETDKEATDQVHCVGCDGGGKACRRAPMRMKRQSRAVPFLRPKQSARYGAKGKTARPPNPGMAPKMPSKEPMG